MDGAIIILVIFAIVAAMAKVSDWLADWLIRKGWLK